jgi:hypothetical protein
MESEKEKKRRKKWKTKKKHITFALKIGLWAEPI